MGGFFVIWMCIARKGVKDLPILTQERLSNFCTNVPFIKYERVDRNSESVVYRRGESVIVFFDYLKKTIPIPEDLLEKGPKYFEQGG